MPASKQQLDNLADVTPAALASSDGDEALARVKLAQWIFESGWGAISIRTLEGQNPFGIKAAGPHEPNTIRVTTEELTPAQLDALKRTDGASVITTGPLKPDGKHTVTINARFRLWPTIEAAFRGHTKFLETGHRKKAWERYIAARRPPATWTDPAAINRDVRNLCRELQHLVWLPAKCMWLRYSTSDSYESDIALMALSTTVSGAIEKARRGGRGASLPVTPPDQHPPA